MGLEARGGLPLQGARTNGVWLEPRRAGERRVQHCEAFLIPFSTDFTQRGFAYCFGTHFGRHRTFYVSSRAVEEQAEAEDKLP